MSHPSSVPILEIGSTADLVISSAPRAAMTAIQRMTSARVLTMTCPIIPNHHLATCVASEVTSPDMIPMVVSVTSPNLNVEVSPFDVCWTGLLLVGAVLFCGFMTAPRNMSPNERAAAT